MDKEIKKQLKGKADYQWSTYRPYAPDIHQIITRIFLYVFIVPWINWNLCRVYTTLKTLETAIHDQVLSGQWRPFFNKF